MSISAFHDLLLMMKQRHLSTYKNDDDKLDAFAQEMARQDSFHAKWPRFARLANRYFALVCLCDFGRSTGINDNDIEQVVVSEFSITSVIIAKVPSILRHDYYLNSFVWSRCGQFIAAGCNGDAMKGTLVVRGIDGTKIFTKKYSKLVMSVCFSADSRHVLSGCDDGVVYVFDVDNGNKLMELRGHTDGVQSVSCSNDGALIATHSDDRSVRLWDANTGAEIWKFDGHGGTVWHVTFNHD